MAGFRAAELAGGLLEQRLERLQKQRHALLHHIATNLQATPTDWAQVLADYNLGTQFMIAGLHFELAFWKKLPYLLAGLAHIHETVARSCAAKAVDMFDDSSSGDAVSLHHPITLRFLVHLRDDMELFIQGSSRETLSIAFQHEVAMVRFWPVAERVIEATHKDAKKDAGLMRAGPASYSLAVRARPLLSRACQDHMLEMLQCINRARKFNQVVDELGFNNHPRVRAFASKVQNVAVRILNPQCEKHKVRCCGFCYCCFWCCSVLQECVELHSGLSSANVGDSWFRHLRIADGLRS